MAKPKNLLICCALLMLILLCNSAWAITTVQISGKVLTKAGVAMVGVRVEALGFSNISTTTQPDGSFVLGKLTQDSTVSLKISADGYLPTYTADYSIGSQLVTAPNHLYTQADRDAWGVGNTALVGQVLKAPGTPLGGVVVTATSFDFSNLPVTYTSGALLSTSDDGFFVVPNVSPSPLPVALQAAKSLWSFQGLVFTVHPDGVSEGVLLAKPPVLNGFDHAIGKAGDSIILSGSDFSPVASDNVVSFNGPSATVTAATPTSLTVTVPARAITGPISVTKAGVTVSSSATFTVMNTLSASVTGSNGALGTVTSIPGGISCNTSSPSFADFVQGTSVQLAVTLGEGSYLNGWSGACTGAAPCQINLSGNLSAQANFLPLPYIQYNAAFYAQLKNAFAAVAATGATIQVQAKTVTDSALVFNKHAMIVKLTGGFDSSAFTTNSGYTTLVGKLDIQNGTLKVEKLKIK